MLFRNGLAALGVNTAFGGLLSVAAAVALWAGTRAPEDATEFAMKIIASDGTAVRAGELSLASNLGSPSFDAEAEKWRLRIRRDALPQDGRARFDVLSTSSAAASAPVALGVVRFDPEHKPTRVEFDLRVESPPGPPFALREAPPGPPFAPPEAPPDHSTITADRDVCSSYEGSTISERVGCQIWFYATADNDRFYTYVIQQRLGVLIDWYRVLNTKERGDRFKAWGLINDPGCCVPGSKDCPAKSYDETYGFDWCTGDEELLKFVGKTGYRDPACDLADSAWQALGHGGSTDNRESPCSLRFGTSTGAMGLRKFPNPRFDAEAWKALNGSLGSWEAFGKYLSDDTASPDYRKNKLIDASVEPPFMIGVACGACHIAFDPLNPPRDPSNPKPENIVGHIGNQYTRMSEVIGSGMSPHSLEWEMFAQARPGTVDMSAVANDQVTNPGTINALMNLERRPVFEENVVQWRKTDSCLDDASFQDCWCEPGRPGKCWEYGDKKERIHHILKGGEDSTGASGAIQRFYINIGSCSEQCWVNHLTDLRQADPAHRGFGQTPFDVGQCRRDCSSFRAIEDRLGNVVDFQVSTRATDLHVARSLRNREALVLQLDREYGPGAVERGRQKFGELCAMCHSTQSGPVESRNYWATVPSPIPGKPRIRVDWLGNDVRTPVTEVGTNRSRSLHSNHMKGHIWQAYGSENLRANPGILDVPEPSDGGRGYYRNISLLSLWATAPFLHNNAIGPEVCGNPANKRNDFYRSPYVDENGKPIDNPPPCWEYDPSVAGRYKLYKASMDMLLNPDKRIPKITMLGSDVILDAGPRLFDKGNEDAEFTLVVPQGVPAAFVGSLNHRELIQDVVLSKTAPDQLRQKFLSQGLSAERVNEIVNGFGEALDKIKSNPLGAIDVVTEHHEFIERYYLNTTDFIENKGHTFGEDLSDSEKRDLTAFLATL